MSVAQAQREISGREFAEWMAYHRLEPFGYERQDMGHAITAATIANSAKGKKGKTYRMTDFLPRFGKNTAMSDQQLMEIGKSLKRAWPQKKDK